MTAWTAASRNGAAVPYGSRSTRSKRLGSSLCWYMRLIASASFACTLQSGWICIVALLLGAVAFCDEVDSPGFCTLLSHLWPLLPSRLLSASVSASSSCCTSMCIHSSTGRSGGKFSAKFRRSALTALADKSLATTDPRRGISFAYRMLRSPVALSASSALNLYDWYVCFASLVSGREGVRVSTCDHASYIWGEGGSCASSPPPANRRGDVPVLMRLVSGSEVSLARISRALCRAS